jgi:hypothetical protein
VARRGMAACVGRRRRSVDSGRQKGVPHPVVGQLGRLGQKPGKNSFEFK